MNMKGQWIKAIMVVSVAVLMAFPSPNYKKNVLPSLTDNLKLTRAKVPVDDAWFSNLTGLPHEFYVASSKTFSSAIFDEYAPPSLADHLHMTRSKDPVDGGWLPNLIGLPDKVQVDHINNHIVEVMREETDIRCNSIDSNLRMIVLQNFAIYQHMANAQNIYFDEQMAYKFAHILAMILKESSGDSTSITDMSGRSISTYRPETNLQHWRKIVNHSVQRRIKLNYQTNYGLTQTSADRLFVAFHLAKNVKYNTKFLEGKEGASTPRKIDLNTAIAIRRLIWLYQDFAQGRISQSQGRIHHQDIHKPEFSSRYKAGLRMALFYCGTQLMFQHQHSGEKEPAKLEKAMASIAYCKLGNPHSGYGKDEFDESCFAEWVTLCPALNVDIAALTPLSYFATRGQRPVCKITFKRLINKKTKSE